MRALHEAASSNTDAGLAVHLFCSSVRKQIAAIIGALEGMNLIVFTGGIGENDAVVRAAICGGLTRAGVDLDETRNRSASDPNQRGARALRRAGSPLARGRADRSPHIDASRQ